MQVVSPTAPKRGTRDRFSRQQGRNGEYAQAHSERASIIATLRTGSREATSFPTASKAWPRKDFYQDSPDQAGDCLRMGMSGSASFHSAKKS